MKNTIRSLGEQTADGILYTGHTLLSGVELITDGAAICTVVLYDETSATGTKVYEGGCLGTEQSKWVPFDNPVKCTTGLYLDITGTGASCIVYIG